MEIEQKAAETDKTEKRLSKRQRLFIVVLLRSKSITAACENFGMNRSHFYEWRKNQAFQDALEQAQGELVADGLAELRLNVSGAADVLVSLLNSRDENIQLRAANSLIEHYTRLIETAELEKRLAALEYAGQKEQ